LIKDALSLHPRVAPKAYFLSIPKHELHGSIEDTASVTVCLAREVQPWITMKDIFIDGTIIHNTNLQSWHLFCMQTVNGLQHAKAIYAA
jgi:hypothetical protein